MITVGSNTLFTGLCGRFLSLVVFHCVRYSLVIPGYVMESVSAHEFTDVGNYVVEAAFLQCQTVSGGLKNGNSENKYRTYCQETERELI